MANPTSRAGEAALDPNGLYREEIYTDRLVGTLRVLKSPTPSCPCPLPPQQLATPPARTAQVWLAPAASMTASVRLLTGVGVKRGPSRVPSPICPAALAPQQRAVPFERRAQVCTVPAARDTTWFKFGTNVGVNASVTPDPAPS